MKSDPKVYQAFLDKKLGRLNGHFVQHTEKLTKYMGLMLVDEKVPFKMLQRTVGSEEDGLVRSYIELDFTQDIKRKSLIKLGRYKKKFNLQKVTIDLHQNIENGSLGFYLGAESRIDLGMNGLKSIMLDDVLDFVTLHELRHANFRQMRVERRDSAFHTSYIATGPTPLQTLAPDKYGHYMSAEELYNFANNAFWTVARLKNIANYSAEKVLMDIARIRSEIASGIQLGKQTQEITKNMLEFLQSLRSSKIPRGESQVAFLDALKRPIEKVEDAIYVAAKNPENGHLILVYIDESMLPQVGSYIKKRNDLVEEFNKIIQKKGAPKTKEDAEAFFAEYSAKEALVTQDEQIYFIKKMIENQTKLSYFADNVVARGEEALAYHKNFIKRVKGAFKRNPGFNQKPLWQRKTNEAIHNLRDFGNSVRF